MNDTEIRSRLHEALGDVDYPSGLVSRVGTRLGEAPPHRRSSVAVGIVAAILALSIVGTLLFARVQPARHVAPAATPSSVVRPPATVGPPSQLPEADLGLARLTGSRADLVTPLNLVSEDKGRTITLIGAYADSAQTFLIFRTMPIAGYFEVGIADEQGSLNASSTGGPVSAGDVVFRLNAGPRVGADGLAHLTVTVFGVSGQISRSDRTAGSWTFSFPLKVEPSTALTPTPALGPVGSWKLNVEAFEVTPAVMRFQAVIDGATVSDVTRTAIQLLDPNGQPVPSLDYSAAITIPKQQLGPTPPRQTRVNVTWERPYEAGNYQLVISGGGGQYRGTVSVPAPTPAPVRKGQPIYPTDYPGSSEALELTGAFSASITTGHPSQCGAGSGPSGAIFAFATYFEVQGVWYLIAFWTDPAVRQYRAPGTYAARATLYPYGPMGADPIFIGTVQLTVTSDTAPDRGSVQGTLTWTGAGSQTYAINVSGSWSCVPGPALGPG